jgi:hypothetical protein
MSTDDVLTPDAIELLHLLQRELGETRQEVLSARVARAQRLKQGELPDFLDETEGVRRGDWRVPPAPADLSDRRVEITGPTDRKMVINALNCGRKSLHGRFRGRQLADVAEHDRRPTEPFRRNHACAAQTASISTSKPGKGEKIVVRAGAGSAVISRR